MLTTPESAAEHFAADKKNPEPHMGREKLGV
jgi:hypothetical protein